MSFIKPRSFKLDFFFDSVIVLVFLVGLWLDCWGSLGVVLGLVLALDVLLVWFALAGPLIELVVLAIDVLLVGLSLAGPHRSC